MRIVIDLCVESDGLMFKELINRLNNRGHDVLLTARQKIQAVDLYHYTGLEPYLVGKYATNLEGKLLESAQRIYKMGKIIIKKLGGLDAIVSNTGVEASRVGFGLGASVHTFHDHPQAIHQMLLTIPISSYVYAPWTIPKEIYTNLGLQENQIVSYKGFLTQAWLPYVTPDEDIIQKLGLDTDKEIIVFRESETGAAYLFGRPEITMNAIKRLAKKNPDIQFVARPRYEASNLTKFFKGLNNVIIFDKPIDLQSLWPKASMLIGGGATMCLESTYFGTPTILCRQIDAPITDFLKQTGLAQEAHSVNEIIDLVNKNLGKRNIELSNKIYSDMEFPLEKLIENIEGNE